MAELEQTARYTLKVAPAEALRWLLPDLDADLAFSRWLDTETIAFPGEPGRRCDTVAELVSRSGAAPPWALVLEVEARLRSTILDRVLEYEVRLLRKLRHGPRRRDYQVAAVLILLSGQRGDLKLGMRLPGTKLGLRSRAGTRSLARQRAADTLARIDRGELGLSVLPWLPLMAGGGDPATVQEWLRLARRETVAERRRDCAGLAKVFAERTGWLPVWKEALETFDMWQSQVIKEWKDAGRQEEKRNDLLMLLQARFKAEVPADLSQTIQQTDDLGTLSQWLLAVLEVASLDEFRSRMQTTAPPTKNN